MKRYFIRPSYLRDLSHSQPEILQNRVPPATPWQGCSQCAKEMIFFVQGQEIVRELSGNFDFTQKFLKIQGISFRKQKYLAKIKYRSWAS